MRPRFVCGRSLPRACSPCAKNLLLIGAGGAKGLLAEGGAGRSPSTTTAAAGLPAILLLIGAVDAPKHTEKILLNRQRFFAYWQEAKRRCCGPVGRNGTVSRWLIPEANMNVATNGSHLPAHGRMACTACFHGEPAEWGRAEQTVDGWMLEHNPLHWGASNPRMLVLGFSKGARQSGALLATPVNDIPYRGFRGTLTKALRVLGLLAAGDRVDRHIYAGEPDWAFASLARCSISAVDPETGETRKSGDVIHRLAHGGPGAGWLGTCVRQHLGTLPPRLRVVVLLSNDDAYVDFCFSLVKALHPGLRRLNDVAYTDGTVTWVHIVHVGGPGANHIQAWLGGAPGKQGDKRRLAVEAVTRALAADPVPPAAAPTAPVGPASAVSARSAPSVTTSASGASRAVPARVFRDVVADALRSHPAVRPHPDKPEGTKYIHAYLTRTGRVLAHEVIHAGIQPIWVAQAGCRVSALSDIPHQDRAAGTRRHSNLGRYPDLKDGAVYRFFPRTREDVLRIIEAVSGSRV